MSAPTLSSPDPHPHSRSFDWKQVTSKRAKVDELEMTGKLIIKWGNRPVTAADPPRQCRSYLYCGFSCLSSKSTLVNNNKTNEQNSPSQVIFVGNNYTAEEVFIPPSHG